MPSVTGGHVRRRLRRRPLAAPCSGTGQRRPPLRFRLAAAGRSRALGRLVIHEVLPISAGCLQVVLEAPTGRACVHLFAGDGQGGCGCTPGRLVPAAPPPPRAPPSGPAPSTARVTPAAALRNRGLAADRVPWRDRADGKRSGGCSAGGRPAGPWLRSPPSMARRQRWPAAATAGWTFVPVSAERIVVHDPDGDDRWAHATVRAGDDHVAASRVRRHRPAVPASRAAPLRPGRPGGRRPPLRTALGRPGPCRPTPVRSTAPGWSSPPTSPARRGRAAAGNGRPLLVAVAGTKFGRIGPDRFSASASPGSARLLAEAFGTDPGTRRVPHRPWPLPSRRATAWSPPRAGRPATGARAGPRQVGDAASPHGARDTGRPGRRRPAAPARPSRGVWPGAGAERPELRATLIDLDPTGDDAPSSAAGGGPPAAVAHRRRRRYVARLGGGHRRPASAVTVETDAYRLAATTPGASTASAVAVVRQPAPAPVSRAGGGGRPPASSC
jgi:hypothetical protein